MSSDKRVHVTLECTQCKRRNYITTKSKVNDRERIELKKYCKWERTHTVHKERAERLPGGSDALSVARGRDASSVCRVNRSKRRPGLATRPSARQTAIAARTSSSAASPPSPLPVMRPDSST